MQVAGRLGGQTSRRAGEQAGGIGQRVGGRVCGRVVGQAGDWEAAAYGILAQCDYGYRIILCDRISCSRFDVLH